MWSEITVINPASPKSGQYSYNGIIKEKIVDDRHFLSKAFAIIYKKRNGVSVINSNLYSDCKSGRILYLYTKLINGESINKSDEAKRFGVHNRSIQRDIDDLRMFFENQSANGGAYKELVYDKSKNCYYLRSDYESELSDSEIFAVCKILLESRSMCRSELEPIITKLLDICGTPNDRKTVKAMISNELLYYVEPHHKKRFINDMWQIGNAVREHKLLKIRYRKQDDSVVERLVRPVGIMFSEFYFYLTAFIENIDKQAEFDNPDDIFPTIYRIDRIQEYSVLDVHFDIPYKDKFNEGEFRKRIQFMYGGRLRRVKFRYTGKNVEAVLDRLPTAEIIKKDDEGYVVSAEVFGNGVDMWMRSQGENVCIL